MREEERGRREQAREGRKEKNITRVHQSHKGIIVSFTGKVLAQNEFLTHLNVKYKCNNFK